MADDTAMFESEALRCTENAERLLGLSETSGSTENAGIYVAQAQAWATLALTWRTGEQTDLVRSGAHLPPPTRDTVF